MATEKLTTTNFMSHSPSIFILTYNTNSSSRFLDLLFFFRPSPGSPSTTARSSYSTKALLQKQSLQIKYIFHTWYFSMASLNPRISSSSSSHEVRS